MDFSSAQMWGGGHSGDWGAVPRLNHVSSIGFNIGTDIGSGDYQGDSFDLQIAPVPEPGTLMLLGSGAMGLFGFRRRLRLLFRI